MSNSGLRPVEYVTSFNSTSVTLAISVFGPRLLQEVCFRHDRDTACRETETLPVGVRRRLPLERGRPASKTPVYIKIQMKSASARMPSCYYLR